MINSIFISRKLQEDSPFNVLLNTDAKIKLIDEALINIVQIRYSYAPKTKWVFFSSKNAIAHFFAQNPELDNDVQYGVVSEVSEEELLKFGKTASFVGDNIDMLQVAKNFRDVLKDDSVLFPQAIDSLQTIQKQLAFTNTCYNLYVYKTVILTDFTIPYTDVAIFTSPSNATAYFSKYKTNPEQLIIAMGNATKYRLSGYGIRNIVTPNRFNEHGLFDVLLQTGALEGIL